MRDLTEMPAPLMGLCMAWVKDATIPVWFMSEAGSKKTISENDALPMAKSTDRPGFSISIELNGSFHKIYATYNEYSVWVDANWNEDHPTFHGDIVKEAITIAINKERDRRVAEKLAEKLAALSRDNPSLV